MENNSLQITPEYKVPKAGSFSELYNYDRNNLRLVIIDCPYESWHLPLTRELFGKMVNLKLSGFKHHYPSGVLPVDTSDFLAIHILACLENDGELMPVMGYRIMSLQRTLNFNILFPALSLAKAANAPVHARVIDEHITRCVAAGKNISYLGSWTIHPDVQKNSELRRDLRHLFLASHVQVQNAYGLNESILGATLRFKVDRLVRPLGYNPLSDETNFLQPISVAHLFNEKVCVMHLQRFTDEALEIAEMWHPHWKNRITTGVKDFRNGC